MTDARRERTTTGRVYRTGNLPEPAVEVNAPRPPAPARRSQMGLVLAVGLVSMLLGVGVAAWLWAPKAAATPGHSAAEAGVQP